VSTISVPTATGRSLVSGAIGFGLDGSVGGARFGVDVRENRRRIGLIDVQIRLDGGPDSSLARRKFRSRATIRPSSGSFDGPTAARAPR